jgi:hypothetical protein
VPLRVSKTKFGALRGVSEYCKNCRFAFNRLLWPTASKLVLDWWAVDFQSWPLDQMRSAQIAFRSLFILEASQHSIYLFVEETGTSSSDVSALVLVEHW